MVTVRRGWSCAITCEPARPCFGRGCPNARQASYCPNPNYYNLGYGPGPNYNPNLRSLWRRFSLGPRRPPGSSPQSNPDPNIPEGTVRIGVGNVSNTDIEIDVRDNLVRGGRRRVEIGSGNYAARSNMGAIADNLADTDELMIGVDNYSRTGDNNIRVRNNDFRGGFDSVRVGVGNYAGGSNRIVVDGSGSGPDSGGWSGSAGGGWGGWWGPRRNSGSGGNSNRAQQGGEGRRRSGWNWF